MSFIETDKRHPIMWIIKDRFIKRTPRTYWAWETTATLRLLGGARGAGAPTGGGEGRGISCRHAHSLLQ